MKSKIKILKTPKPIVEKEMELNPNMMATHARMNGGEAWFQIGWMVCKLTIENMEENDNTTTTKST